MGDDLRTNRHIGVGEGDGGTFGARGNRLGGEDDERRDDLADAGDRRLTLIARVGDTAVKSGRTERHTAGFREHQIGRFPGEVCWF